jgi:hypothetical protein
VGFETLISRLFRDSVQFCSGLVDLVVCARRVVIGLVAEGIRRWAIAVVISGTDADVGGPRAKPAILAAGS